MNEDNFNNQDPFNNGSGQNNPFEGGTSNNNSTTNNQPQDNPYAGNQPQGNPYGQPQNGGNFSQPQNGGNFSQPQNDNFNGGYSQPQNDGYNPGYSQPQGTPYGQANYAAQPQNKFTKYLILSILEIFLCGGIFGILSLIFTCIGNGSFNKGDYNDADSKYKTSKIFLIIGLVLGLLVWVFVIITSVLAVKSVNDYSSVTDNAVTITDDADDDSSTSVGKGDDSGKKADKKKSQREQYTIGDTFTTADGLEVTVDNVLAYDVIPSGNSLDDNVPDDGKMYAVFYLSVTNNGDESNNIVYDADKIYADGQSCGDREWVYTDDATFENGYADDGAVDPGMSTKAYIVYQIPKDASQIQLIVTSHDEDYNSVSQEIVVQGTGAEEAPAEEQPAA